MNIYNAMWWISGGVLPGGVGIQISCSIEEFQFIVNGRRVFLITIGLVKNWKLKDGRILQSNEINILVIDGYVTERGGACPKL